MQRTRRGTASGWWPLLLWTVVLGGWGCGGGSDSPVDPDDGGSRALTSMEEALLGKWSRYHRFDDSYDFYIFKGDRTACYWERSSSGSRRDQKSYPHWELNETAPLAPNVFKIVLRTSSGGTLDGDQFHYVEKEVWLGGYDNLRMFPATTSDDC